MLTIWQQAKLFTVVVIFISIVVGFLLHSEHLPDTFKKVLIVTSMLGILGMCTSPIED